jgi:hypothetical protein
MKFHFDISSLFHFGDLEQIADLSDLAAGLVVVGLDGGITDLAQPRELAVAICFACLPFRLLTSSTFSLAMFAPP